MFSIGDKVVYPMHGAGVIKTVKEQEFLGEKRKYYEMQVPRGDVRLMVPCDHAEAVGVRYIIKKTEVTKVGETLSAKSPATAKVWNRRYRNNVEKLRTGQIMSVAEVVRDLMRVDNDKKLSSGEKKMLSQAKEILLSELALASGKQHDELVSFIEQRVMA